MEKVFLNKRQTWAFFYSEKLQMQYGGFYLFWGAKFLAGLLWGEH